ncbi:hypothetical protein Ndes2526B_g04412 [Nannochloris sp. 'desiccata']
MLANYGVFTSLGVNICVPWRCRSHVVRVIATANESPEQAASGEIAGPFVRRAPLISYERLRVCNRCNGSGEVPCAGCSGVGRLPAGGYHSRNPISAARVVGSSWTAMERTIGWRHFRVTQKKKQGKDVFVCLEATCDSNVSLWTNIKNLKDRGTWAAGWLQKTEMRALEAQAGGKECRSCKATGNVPCPLCQELAGKIIEL